jgi:MerR family transcriptional regulator, copper efflux regulator
LYGDDDVAVLRFIRRAKQLGFTLKEIKALLALRLDGTPSRSDARAQAAAKIADIGARIRDLRRMRAALTALTAACHGDGRLCNGGSLSGDLALRLDTRRCSG